MSIKPFPACHFAHASTWAAAEIASENQLAPDDIAEIVVRIPETGIHMVLDPLAEKHRPRTPYDAKFSLPFTVAHLIVRGSLGLDAFSDESIADPEILDLARRVRAEPINPAHEDHSRFSGGARTITYDGRRFDRWLPHAPGSPNNPLDEEWILRKFSENVALAVQSDQVEPILRAVRGIGSVPQGRTTMDLVAAACAR